MIQVTTIMTTVLSAQCNVSGRHFIGHNLNLDLYCIQKQTGNQYNLQSRGSTCTSLAVHITTKTITFCTRFSSRFLNSRKREVTGQLDTQKISHRNSNLHVVNVHLEILGGWTLYILKLPSLTTTTVEPTNYGVMPNRHSSTIPIDIDTCMCTNK